MAPNVAVIVPQFHHCRMTVECLSTLRHTLDDSVDILIVDDGTPPEHLNKYCTTLNRLGRIVQQSHRGVTAAWNHAARQTDARWLVFLNNDTRSLGPWADRLIAPLTTGAASMTGVAWRDEPHLPKDLSPSLLSQRFLSGWCFAIARERLLALGGFDESLALYFSDTDLQLQLRRESPRDDPLLCVEGLPLVHDGHRTAHRLSNHWSQWERDRRRFRDKWSPTSGDRPTCGCTDHIASSTE